MIRSVPKLMITVLRKASQNLKSERISRKFWTPIQGLPRMPLLKSYVLKASVTPYMGAKQNTA